MVIESSSHYLKYVYKIFVLPLGGANPNFQASNVKFFQNQTA